MSFVDKARNALQGTKGTVEEAVGDRTDDGELTADGKTDQHEADAKKLGEKVKDDLK